MEHIKTPLRVKQGTWAGDLLDADGNNICEMSEDDPFPMACEIVQAVNEHDDLVTQRDALVAVVWAAKAWLDAQERFDSDADRYLVDVLDTRDKMIPLVHAALALVKGDDADQD